MILPKLLLIEDDPAVALALSHALKQDYDIDIANSGRAAIYSADSEKYLLFILDLNLPDIGGLAVCQQLRERGQTAPILVLTAESEVLTKIKLLDAGANDYLTKPFSLGELKARLRANLRPVSRQIVPALGQLSAGGLFLDRSAQTVHREGQIIRLRRKEFALLECLMENADTIVSRGALNRFAWQDSENIWTNTLDVHIKYLRDKLDKPFDQKLIKTVHGTGYKLSKLEGSQEIRDN